MWPDRRFLDLAGIELPIIQAPMAGANLSAMAIAVSKAGGLGSLPCAMLSKDQARAELELIRQQTGRPVNVNFFCHAMPPPDPRIETRWREHLAGYYAEWGIDPAAASATSARLPFDEAMCDLVVAMRPRVVSFHFGLPKPALVDRVKQAGCVVLSSATTVAEARWLEDQGADAVIAQGFEAGGHRGMFLTEDIAAQVGTFALVPQVVDCVRVPVIAAGAIADARGIAAAFALGAAAVQIGTAYLKSPEATISAAHRAALSEARDDDTVLTNVFTGRPARGIANRLVREAGPLSQDAPPFPLAAGGVQPLRAKAEAAGSGAFSPLWSGQAVALAREMAAGELTAVLAAEALSLLQRMAGQPR